MTNRRERVRGRYAPRKRKSTVVPSWPRRERVDMPEREAIERAIYHARVWGEPDPERASLEAHRQACDGGLLPDPRRRYPLAEWLGDAGYHNLPELVAMLIDVDRRARRHALQLPRRNPTRVLCLQPAKREVNIIACDEWPARTVDRLSSARYLADYRPRKPFVPRKPVERVFAVEVLR